ENFNKNEANFSEESREHPKFTQIVDSSNRPLTLLERKRLQWVQENEELARPSKGRAFSTVYYPTMAEDVIHHDKAQNPAPPAKNHYQYKRCNYLAGLPVGEDPLAEAELREQKRRQWLADLDQQIEERRIARERERLKNLALDSAPSRGGQEIDSSLTRSAYVEVKSTGYGRGRGLADLMGRQESDSATKRQQQQELKPASQPRSRLNDLEKIKKAQFGSTYTIPNPTGRPNSGSIEVRNQNRIKKDAPTVVRTESTLISSTSPHPPSFPPNHPTSDFLSAIADPDFTCPQVSRDSALREVFRIKENLVKRQNELRSMQQNY
ncbi:unnamed protein product, partial [Hymenolepis diminuta]